MVKVSVYLVRNKKITDLFFFVSETNDTTLSESSETEPSGEHWERTVDMAARPLPVPVENEPYYFNIDRSEAENLLMGQPDGTFILRPSSQVRRTKVQQNFW